MDWGRAWRCSTGTVMKWRLGVIFCECKSRAFHTANGKRQTANGTRTQLTESNQPLLQHSVQTKYFSYNLTRYGLSKHSSCADNPWVLLDVHCKGFD